MVGKRDEDATGKAVELLRQAAEWIGDNAEELVGDMESMYVTEDGLLFTVELKYGSLPTVTANKTFIVLPKIR